VIGGTVVAAFYACGANRARYINVRVDNGSIPPSSILGSTKVKLTIYPNPSQSIINILVPLEDKALKKQVTNSKSTLIEVYDAKGILKSSQKSSHIQPYQIDISNLSPGNYFLKVKVGMIEGTGMFIKM
jgi:hypothetical protein